MYEVEGEDGSDGQPAESYDEARSIASDEGGRVLARVYYYSHTNVLDDFSRS